MGFRFQQTLTMAAATLLSPFVPVSICKAKQTHLSSPKLRVFATKNTKISRTISCTIFQDQKCISALLGAAGFALTTFVGPTFAAELPASVPLLGGAFCACTWHFFYNAESLEILVALQAALTVIGNATMCIAAFRIFKSSQENSKNL